MTILAQYHQTPVEILDVYTSGNTKLATVKALEGLPFVGGDVYPVRTEYTIAKVDELEPAECTCVLPEQSCPVCRQYLADLYQNEIPFIGR